MNIVLGILITLLTLFLFVWAGLKIRPKPFKPYDVPISNLKVVPLPEDLPAPVARFYRQIYDNYIPVIQSAVISGRMSVRFGPITFPGRFRFTHVAGKDYRHYLEATLFRLPIMKVNEHYLNGKSRLELPFGVVENESKVDQAANLGLWAESIWLPAIFITDPRVRWEPVDQETAILVVPFGDDEQCFVVRFDPQTGLATMLEAMRYKDAADEAKTLWINQAMAWGEIDGQLMATVGAVTWMVDGFPWAVFTVEEIVFNTDVSEYVKAKGI